MAGTFQSRRWLFAWACVQLLLAAPAWAAPESEKLLPNTTKGYFSTDDVVKLQASFDKTQLGQLMLDPVMKPFSEDLRRQMKDRWTRIYEKLGLTLDDLKGVPSGEVAMALIQPAEKQAAIAILMDVTGHKAEAEELLAKIDRNLTKQKATKAQRQVHGAQVSTYTLPKEGQAPAQQSVFFLHDDMLVGVDHPAVAEAMLGRFSGDHDDALADVEAYREIMSRVARTTKVPAPLQLEPEARWFVEPFGYLEAMRIASPPREKKRGKDLLKIFGEQGFKAIQGIGGFVNFAVEDRYELVHRTAVYAPAVKDAPAGQKYLLAARMLRFPNGGDLHPPAWVPRELATYGSFNLDITNAFDSIGSLVDAIVGEPGVFDDVRDSLKNDPNGPRIDLREDLVVHLGQRVTMITDYALPITPKCERLVVGVETKNEKALAATIEKTMKADPDARRVEFGDHIIWEIVQPEAEDLPALDVDGGGLDPLGGVDEGDDDDAEMEEEHRGLPNSAVCVAHGHLLVATHIDFLKRILTKHAEAETLAKAGDYQFVMAELERITGDTRSVRFFSRTDEEYRPTYELIRTGKMPESETLFGKLLNRMFGEGKEGELRKQKIDGSKLPEFETVRRYFGPAGLSVISEDNGWFLLGVTVRKDASPRVANAEGDQNKSEEDVAKE